VLLSYQYFCLNTKELHTIRARLVVVLVVRVLGEVLCSVVKFDVILQKMNVFAKVSLVEGLCIAQCGRRLIGGIVPLFKTNSSVLMTHSGRVRFASTFKAAIVKDFGKPLTIEAMKQKSLKKGQVRIGVYCCGINTIDKHNVLGEVEPKLILPFVPGFEVYTIYTSQIILAWGLEQSEINFDLQVCGEVLEVSSEDEKSRVKPGERVIALNSEFIGGFAEEIIVSLKVYSLSLNMFHFSRRAVSDLLFYLYFL